MGIYQIPFYVYQITCLPTGQYYYGSRYAHVKNNRAPDEDLWKVYFTSSIPVKNLLSEHGVNAFKPDILLTSLSRDEVFWTEQDYIKSQFGNQGLLNSYYVDKDSSKKVFGWTEHNLQIMTAKIKQHVENGTHNFLGGQLQQQAQLRRLAAGTHTSQDPVWLENHRVKQRSAETRARKSASLKAYNATDEGKRRRREITESESWKINMQAGINKYYEEHPEARFNNGVKAMNTPRAISAKNRANKLRNRTQGTKDWFICETTGDIFCNLKHASEVLPISSSGVGLVLAGKYPTMKGLSFRYLTSQEVEQWLKSPQYQKLVQLYKPPS